MKTLLMTISLSILCLVPAGARSQTLETIENGTVQPSLSSETIGTFNRVVYVRYVAGTTPINWLPFIRSLLVTGTK